MAILRLYENSGLTTLVTLDGDYANPDDESSLDGTSGVTSIKALWVAPEQTTLAEILDDSETAIDITAARFADTDYPVIIIDSEKMLITAGFGTTTLTVIRGHNSTTAATHTNGTAILAAYDFTSITIDGQDNTGTDESGWLTYGDDDGGGSPDGSWAAPHTVSNIAYNSSQAIHRRVIVPSSTPAEYKRDLLHRLVATINETT